MIKEREQLLRRLLMIVDIFVVCAAFFSAFIFRQNVHTFYIFDFFPEKQVIGELYPMFRYLSVLPLLIFVWWIALSYSGLYNSFRTKKFFEIVSCIVKSTFFVIVIFATLVFVFKLDFISRTFILFSFAITCLLLVIERWIIVASLRYLRKKGYNYRNILLVGTGPRVERFIKLIHSHNEWGLRIVGLIDAEEKGLRKTVCSEKVIGLLEDIPAILQENVVDEVVFIVPRKWLSNIENSLLDCEIQGVKACIATDFFNTKIARWMSSDIEGIPFIGFKTIAGEEWQLFIKRLFDIILSLIGIIVALPLFIILSIVIKSVCGRPIVFKQVRNGLNGRKFVMYKFRTMVNGAQEEKERLGYLNEMNGPAFKMRNDPRITRLGKFLRMTSLDELPQLFNILKGEMSIVGPRPPIPAEVEKYEIWQRRRLSMKPGLTCLWQANGRNNVDFDKWMKMDLEYIDSWSLGLDFKILLKTIPVVLFSVGAR
jgi:exopolysaccharide biosynthesis polyprenyl glycosylphosphotransferase